MELEPDKVIRMQINYNILENGDLEFTVKFDDEEEKLEVIETSKHDYQASLELFWEEVAGNSTFRFIGDEEKVYCGDLYSGDILTDIDYLDYEEMGSGELLSEIDDRTWFYKYYVTTFFTEELFIKGTVVWTCRKNS